MQVTQATTNALLLSLGALFVVETTGFGMGFLDLVLDPLTNLIDRFVEDKEVGFGLLLPVRKLLLAHRRRRDFVKYYWPKVTEQAEAVGRAEKLDELLSKVPPASYKSRERVYPSGDSEFYESRVPVSDIHVPDATRF